MEHLIGTIAGKVWNYLNENGETSFKKLKEALFSNEKVAMEEEKLAMAIGWLLREGKLNVIESGSGRGYRLSFELKK